VGNGNSYTASPVAAYGIIYIADNDEKVYSVKTGPEFQLIQTNNWGETLMSTPAISQNYMFFKTINHLIAVSETSKN